MELRDGSRAQMSVIGFQTERHFVHIFTIFFTTGVFDILDFKYSQEMPLYESCI